MRTPREEVSAAGASCKTSDEVPLLSDRSAVASALLSCAVHQTPAPVPRTAGFQPTSQVSRCRFLRGPASDVPRDRTRNCTRRIIPGASAKKYQIARAVEGTTFYPPGSSNRSSSVAAPPDTVSRATLASRSPQKQTLANQTQWNLECEVERWAELGLSCSTSGRRCRHETFLLGRKATTVTDWSASRQKEADFANEKHFRLPQTRSRPLTPPS